MIMKLKMYTKGKNFLVKFVSKLFEVWTDAWKMGQDSVFWWGDSEPSPVDPLVVNPWGLCLSDYCNNFGKSERAFSFKVTNLQR